MAKSLRFNRLVVDDLNKAVDWYCQRSAGVADRFCAAVDYIFDQIAESPERKATIFADLPLRGWRVNQFPYLILFRIDQDIVVIEGVFHTASDPESWRRRAAN